MVTINEELKALIPPLTEEEFKGLEEDIRKDGCRDALVIWKGKDTIVDGHNRHKICSEHNIPYKTIEKEFSSIEDVKLWMIDNQKSRRNLTDGWKFELAQAKKAILLEKGRANISANRGGTTTLSNVDKEAHNTQKELAKDLGWSSGKVAMADKVWSKAPDELKEEVKKGKKTFNEVYSEIRKKERATKIKEQEEGIKTGKIKLPEGKFQVIVIDPPWYYEGGSEAYDPISNRGQVTYPTLTIEQLKDLNIQADDNCIMWLWTTHKFIWDAKQLLEHWGFKYKAMVIWDKEKMGIGRWLRLQCEFCLMGVKGSPIWKGTGVRDIIREARTTHSTKPNAFYKMVEDNCVGRKLDYFARKKRDGWDVYGDEIQEVDEVEGREAKDSVQ
jgi:N6-adenosine-specific RNA methylase IME4